MIDFKSVLNNIHISILQETGKGKVADYIPELLHVNKNAFGIYLNVLGEANYGVGDYKTSFSIQSISKVLSLAQALSLYSKNI